MGSSSDLEIMDKAAEVLKNFNCPFHLEILSAHRTPEEMLNFAAKAHGRGFKVIIAGAGGAAHLPGMIAAATTLPVIGVPIKSTHSLNGLDSLLSIVQMPAGVPVATMAIDGAANAALFAIQILALSNATLASALDANKQQLKNKVQKMNQDLKSNSF
jgi:5-(carboxyamino)imidazole ribonucleotide mutase